jgi:hypothetical protein
MDYSILLYSSTACAVDKIVIRGERTCCLGKENEDAEGEMGLLLAFSEARPTLTLRISVGEP